MSTRFPAAAAILIGFLGTHSATAVTVIDHRDPSVSGGAYVLNAQPVFELSMALNANQQKTCETRNSSPGADPVLHLLAPPLTGNGEAHEVARDDDSAGSLNARFTYTATVKGTYRLVLRASGEGRTGTTDVYCDGKAVWLKLPVNGAFKRLESLRPREQVITVPLPQGPVSHIVYLLSDQGALLERYLSLVTQSTTSTIGSQKTEIVMVGTLWPSPSGPLRVVRNDNALSGHDPDGDGLGTELEKQIGTCSTTRDVVANWDCSRTLDPRDTDGDGLWDGWELLGITNSTPYLLLPRWGANPTHKDLFIEVDSRSSTQNDSDHILQPKEALALAQIYADPETSPVLRLLHAQTLQNPDLQAGIIVHLDTGLDPAPGSPALDWTTYGNWGGHNIVPATCNASGCTPRDAADVWKTMMLANRHGVFHYALGYPGGGGQAPYHSISLNLPLGDGPTAAHELGHTLGMDHSGPVHSAPDANCKPNYPSIMSYAFLGNPSFSPEEFSDGYGRPTLNNVSLTEKNAVPTSASSMAYLKQLRDVLGFNVDLATGSVDWNRDGAFSAGTVRAYANDNGSCEFTRVNAVPSTGLSSGAPSITRLVDKTILLYVDERNAQISMDYTKDDLSCPGVEGRCGPPLTHASINTAWNKGILAVDAHRIVAAGKPKLLLVYRTSAGLFETLLSPDLSWSTPARVPIPGQALDEFSLTGNDAHTILAYKNGDSRPVMKVRSSNPGTWDGDEIARDASGAFIPTLGAGSSPGILEARFHDGTTNLLAVFPVTDQGLLRLYVQDRSNGRWSVSPWQNSEEPSIGRPALAWVPLAPESPLPGRLRILSLRRSPTGITVVRMRSLQAIGLGPAAKMRLVDEDFDNSWYYGKGVGMLYEDGVDSNLRAVVVTALFNKSTPQPHLIELRPKADGVVDFLQRNADDWLGLGVDLCRVLNSSGSGSLHCPAWPF